jgi:hypothetical protein
MVRIINDWAGSNPIATEREITELMEFTKI